MTRVNYDSNAPKLGWLLTVSKLLILFRLLQATGRLDERTDFEEFERHFTGSATNVIYWCGSAVELVQIFGSLIEICAVPYQRRHIQVLTMHFAQEDGSSFNPDSLRAMNSRIKKNFVGQLIKRLNEAFDEDR